MWYFSPAPKCSSPGHVDPQSDTSYLVNVKTPGEVLFDFPLTFDKTWNYTYASYDTTYINGRVTSTAADTESRTTTIDGYGTLILPSGDSLQCLRLFQGPGVSGSTISDSGLGVFTFMYMTVTGTFVIVNAPGNEPTTGKIAIQNVQVIEGTLPTSIRTKSNAPSSFSLYQNYPNPFNPTTTIRFDLKEQSNVTLEIYNVLGQRVVYRNKGIMDAGRYNGAVDMSRFASGIYFYRIVASPRSPEGASGIPSGQGNDGERFTAIRKLMLVK